MYALNFFWFVCICIYIYATLDYTNSLSRCSRKAPTLRGRCRGNICRRPSSRVRRTFRRLSTFDGFYFVNYRFGCDYPFGPGDKCEFAFLGSEGRVCDGRLCSTPDGLGGLVFGGRGGGGMTYRSGDGVWCCIGCCPVDLWGMLGRWIL